MTRTRMAQEFVRAIPDQLEAEVLYISVEYVTTSHLCACGCGAEVVLPLHPTKWRLTFDGASVSMSPSVGSRTLPCRSHYWIDGGEVRWAPRMSDAQFERALQRDARDDRAWHGGPEVAPVSEQTPATAEHAASSEGTPRPTQLGALDRAAHWLKRLVGI